LLPQHPIANASSSTEPQVFPNQAEACQGAEAEPPCASVDSPPNWQHHPVRLIPFSRNDDYDFAYRIPNEHKGNISLTLLNSYNAKRRHWRKTRIGI
jgi:hypothetical protein